MKPRLITLLVVMVMTAAGYFILQAKPVSQDHVTPSAASEISPSKPPVSAIEPSVSSLEALDLESIEQARIRDYYDQLNASDQIKQQFAELEHLAVDAQESLAEELLSDIDSKENGQHISHSEAIFLKLALMKKILPQDRYVSYAEQLIEDHNALVKANEEAYKNRSDPQFTHYKQQEAQIAREVLQMQEFPDGLTREQYLRKRLDEVRRDVYSVKENGG